MSARGLAMRGAVLEGVGADLLSPSLEIAVRPASTAAVRPRSGLRRLRARRRRCRRCSGRPWKRSRGAADLEEAVAPALPGVRRHADRARRRARSARARRGAAVAAARLRPSSRCLLTFGLPCAASAAPARWLDGRRARQGRSARRGAARRWTWLRGPRCCCARRSSLALVVVALLARLSSAFPRLPMLRCARRVTLDYGAALVVVAPERAADVASSGKTPRATWRRSRHARPCSARRPMLLARRALAGARSLSRRRRA